MQPCELVSSITAVACFLAQGESTEQIELMASIFSQLGDTLATIAVQKECCESKETAHIVK